MDDLISRKAAIEAIYAEFEYVYCFNCDHEGKEEWCEDCHRKYMKWSASWNAIERALNGLPSAQPEPICVAKVTLTDEQVKEAFEKAKGEILAVQSVREERWIPFKTRSLTEEEKEEHPEWECILDCILPDDGQAILVSINLKGHERVQYDEFYTDDGSYLDSGYEIGSEATAWMPLPEPYREEEQDD